jgi:Protein of unknown function (DUF1573)/Flagellar-associated PapD-like
MYASTPRPWRILIPVATGALMAALVVCYPSFTAAQLPGAPALPPAQAAPSGPQPHAEIAAPVYNFGTVFNGAAVKHVFTIINSGQAPLVIGEVTTSCGCTAAKPTKTRLAPGEKSEITVTLDTRVEKGHVVRTVTALTNDPKSAQAVMTLQGDVKLQVEGMPAEVALGDVRHGTEVTRKILVSELRPARDFKVGPISNSAPYIKVTQGPRSDGKPGAELTIALLKTAPVGPFSDTVRVATSLVPLEIPVFGNVTGDLVAKPAQVSFGIVPHKQGVIRIVRLTNQGDRTVRVLGISSTSNSVTAEVQPVKPGKEYKITLELRKNTPDGQLRGQLAVHTDDPQQATVTIPYYAIVGSFQG